jgi:hypothetical protein
MNLVGKTNYENMEESNPRLAAILYIPYMFFYFFIILNLLMAVIMRHFEYLAETTQREILANARMLEEDGKKWTANLLNFLMCVRPMANPEREEKNRQQPSSAPRSLRD